MHTLFVKILTEPVSEAYKIISSHYTELANRPTTYKNDCGIDLIVPSTINCPVNKVTMLKLGIACRFEHDKETTCSDGFMLVPRSSISKTPLMLANSIGIIDPGYRGELMAALRCVPDSEKIGILDNYNNQYYSLKRSEKIVQIVAFDGNPIKVQLVNSLDQTDRGANGFGSTDNVIKN